MTRKEVKPKHPMQPVIKDTDGVHRFKRNKIVEYLLDHNNEGRKIDMNLLARMDFSNEDRTQFAQLIGYSVSGFCELHYVSNRDASTAMRRSEQLAKGSNS